MPKFSILNPKFTMTVPENQMKAGITETTVVYPAGYLDLTKEDITKILKESM
jgi:alcohol dehydrogenase YqhD (iron-dependent ADH family)